MNEEIQEIYEKMFAPNPMPPSVGRAFDVASKYASRMDCPGFKIKDFALIATIGVLSESQRAVPAHAVANTKVAPATDVIDFRESTEDADAGTEPKKATVATTEVVRPSHGPTGVMDAPSRPSTRRRALSNKGMNRLTKSELIVHAKEIYGFIAKKNIRKVDLVAVLMNREPL